MLPVSSSRTTIVLTVSLLSSCTGAGVLVSDEAAWTNPAPSAERAVARYQREVRKKAQSEQGPGFADPEPVDEDEPSVDAGDGGDAGEPEESVVPAETTDAGVEDAGPIEAAAIAEPNAPLDLTALCATLCERATRCALARMEDKGVDPDTIERMRGTMSAAIERCQTGCTTKAEEDKDDQEKVATVQACLALEECEGFMECLEEALGND